MKRKLITGILGVLLFPFVISGQPETFTVSVANFSSAKYDEFSPVYYKKGVVFCSNKSQNLVSNYKTSDNKGLFKINYIENISQDGNGKQDFYQKF